MVGYKQTLCALLLTEWQSLKIIQTLLIHDMAMVSWLISHLQTVKQWEGSLTDCAMDHISIR